MNALGGTGIDGLLDIFFSTSLRIYHLGKTQGFVQPEDLGADFLTSTAGNALFFHNDGVAPAQGRILSSIEFYVASFELLRGAAPAQHLLFT